MRIPLQIDPVFWWRCVDIVLDTVRQSEMTSTSEWENKREFIQDQLSYSAKIPRRFHNQSLPLTVKLELKRIYQSEREYISENLFYHEVAE